MSNPIGPTEREHAASLQTQLVHKHPAAIRWMHWINFPVLFIMIYSGLRIYWANHQYFWFPDSFYDLLVLERHLADGMKIHFSFMWIFAINGLTYVTFLLASGEWRVLFPNRATLSEAKDVVLHDLGISKKPLPDRKFNGAQRIAYTGVILLGAGSLITGLAIYKPVQLGWLIALLGGYQAARIEHFYITMAYLAFFVIHIVQVIKAGWNNFRSMVTGYELVKPKIDEA